MKNYVLLHYGFETPTDELMQAWGAWFGSIASRTVDIGSPFEAGTEVTRTGTKALSMDREALTGYTIISAEDIDEAVKVAQTCPIVTSIRIYEAVGMQVH